MTLTSGTAIALTNIAVSNNASQDLQTEVGLTEAAILNATGREKFEVLYNAPTVGNPPADPQVDANLTPLQISYRDAFVDAGFFVSLDSESGFWKFSWALTGADALVSIYSLRTTLSPGAISAQTITAISNYLEGLTPIVRATIELAPNSGDLDETAFGGTTQTNYEYTIVAQQPDDTDHADDIRSAVIAAGLGYVDSPSNIFVFRLI